MNMPSNHPVIDCRGLGKRYDLGATSGLRRFLPGLLGPSDAFWALKEVSFCVPRGQVVGILGHHGAGKTTLLKLLSRITDLSCGEAVIRGRVATLLDGGPGFHPELTGRENLHLAGAILGLGARQIRQRLDDIVAFAELERFIDLPVKRYASGMRVRLAMALAAFSNPQVLLVDELFAAGDAAFQARCQTRLEELVRQGCAVLFVSHQLSAVRRLCHRGLVLAGGRLTFDGPVDDALQHYLGLDPRQPRTMRDHVRCSDPGIRIDRVTINGMEHDRLHVDARCDRLRVVVQGEWEAPIPLRLETRMLDRDRQPLTLFTPPSARAEFLLAARGRFTLRETIKLPPLHRGVYHLGLFVTRADGSRRLLVQIDPAAALLAEGTAAGGGWIGPRDRSDRGMLLRRAA